MAENKDKLNTNDLPDIIGNASTNIDKEALAEIQKTWKSVAGTENIGQTIKESAEDVKPPSQVKISEKSVNTKDQGPVEPPPDYEIIGKIGEGGMGVIYTARQSSVDRVIALKMIKGEEEQKQKDLFLSEAVATGNLDHPNIVPVHELGSNKQGQLFYSMKNVTGTAWDEVIKQKSRQENLEILLRVCDAVAFAHSRGVIHRDLKPENVMLGDFGEVYVMDWGLAAAVTAQGKAQPLDTNTASGGTPAYMAPEMGAGDMSSIGKRSDVYLLGAMLYEIVTGTPPHTGKTIYQCIYSVIENRFRETSAKGELIDIAYKAMSTDPDSRYASVQDLQEAIREYQTHAESLELTWRALEDLDDPLPHYDVLSRIVYRFEEALHMWPDNEKAKEGLIHAKMTYAERALANGDFDLAKSLLPEDKPVCRDLLKKVNQAKATRTKRQKRLRFLTYSSVVLIMLIISSLTVAFFWICSEKEKAETEKQKAEIARDDADRAREEAKREAEALLEVLSKINDLGRDKKTASNIRRYALGLGKKAGLEDRRYQALKFAVELMDIGRITILHFIKKDGRLSDEEYAKVKEVPEVSADIAGKASLLKELKVPEIIVAIREKWDGTGEPKGLSGEQIPLESRIIMIAWHYTGMTTDRSFKKGMSQERAIAELRKFRDRWYDPQLVDVFIKMLEDGEFKKSSE